MKPAEPLGVPVQLPSSDENESRRRHHSRCQRETDIKNVLEILGLGDNKCKSQ